MIDRSAVSRALAKALAFKAAGKHMEAEHWATVLVELLECGDILIVNQPRGFRRLEG